MFNYFLWLKGLFKRKSFHDKNTEYKYTGHKYDEPAICLTAVKHLINPDYLAMQEEKSRNYVLYLSSSYRIINEERISSYIQINEEIVNELDSIPYIIKDVFENRFEALTLEVFNDPELHIDQLLINIETRMKPEEAVKYLYDLYGTLFNKSAKINVQNLVINVKPI